MPFSLSTLLVRNPHDVFGEGDPSRRRAAIDEMFTEDRDGRITAVYLFFDKLP